MSPDPPVHQHDGCLTLIEDVIIAAHSSDDSDHEVDVQQGYDGYTLLGQSEHPGEQFDSDNNEEPDNAGSEKEVNTLQDKPPVEPAAGQAELIALWNSPSSSSSTDINMDAEKSAQVRAAMAGFSLPASSVPSWAVNIPEDQWKQRLLARLQGMGQNVPQLTPNNESCDVSA